MIEICKRCGLIKSSIGIASRILSDHEKHFNLVSDLGSNLDDFIQTLRNDFDIDPSQKSAISNLSNAESELSRYVFPAEQEFKLLEQLFIMSTPKTGGFGRFQGFQSSPSTILTPDHFKRVHSKIKNLQNQMLFNLKSFKDKTINIDNPQLFNSRFNKIVSTMAKNFSRLNSIIEKIKRNVEKLF